MSAFDRFGDTKLCSFLTAAFAAALAACQPAPAPDGSEPTTTGAEAPAKTGGAPATVAQPAGETLATETTAFPANCPVVATRNWEARSRPHETNGLMWIDFSGEVDLPPTYHPIAQPVQLPSQDATEAREVLRFAEGVSPYAYSQVVQTAAVRASGLYPESVTHVSIVCGDGVIATIPITSAAP